MNYKKQILLLLFFLIIGFISLLDLFHPGLPITHDGQDHVARIANFYQNLSEGNIIPRWAGNLNWGYGHPILMFLYPLPSYLASFFHLLGFSFVDSTKLVFGTAFILSGLTMYLWIREFLDEKAALIAGIFYMFAPYRFVDLYVRGAIGEHVFFIFPPLVLYFLFKLSQKPRLGYVAGGAFSLAGMILSHNALSLMFLPLIFIYGIYLLLQVKEKKPYAIRYTLITVLGFLLSAFFWGPAFFEGKYTLRDIVTKGNISGFENFSRLIWSPWSYGGTGVFSVQLGILQWLGILIAPFLIWILHKRKNKIWIFFTFLFFLFWGSIFLMLLSSQSVYKAITLLQKFQFAWRFLSLAIFPPAVFLGLLVYLLPNRLKLVALGCFFIIAFWLNKDYWHAKGFLTKPESSYTGIYPGTTDTGESSPRWSVRFMERKAKTHLEVISGEAKITGKERRSTKHEYTVETSKKSRLRENTLYFPGWEVLVDGQKVNIEFQDPQNRGLMTFYVPEGVHNVSVIFEETKLRKFANLISLSSILFLGGIVLFKVVNRMRV